MKLLIAEDLESMREHLSGLLAEARDVELRFVEQDGILLMQTVAAWRPDAVILDASMRGVMALGLVEELKTERPEMAVVVSNEWPGISVAVSALVFQPYFRKAFINRGADFIFDKSADCNELIAFLRRRQAQAAWGAVDAPQMATPIRGREKEHA